MQLSPWENEMQVYDQAKWHFEAEGFPHDVLPEQAYVHTGMYVGWILDNDLYSEELAESACDAIRLCKQRSITGADFYREVLYGTFTSDELSDEGDAFTAFYFNMLTGTYYPEYLNLMLKPGQNEYTCADTIENYEKLKAHIDERYEEFKRLFPTEPVNGIFMGIELFDEEMAEQISKRAGMPIQDAYKFIKALKETTTDLVSGGENAYIPGLGTFNPSYTESFDIRSSIDGQFYRARINHAAKFAPCGGFEEAVDPDIYGTLENLLKSSEWHNPSSL
jgi:nucleoid DNA-binding protein